MKRKSQKKEIIWNIVNSLLAAGLVFLGAIAAGNLDFQAIFAGLIAGFAVALTKFKSYWDGEQGQYSCRIFNFTP